MKNTERKDRPPLPHELVDFFLDKLGLPKPSTDLDNISHSIGLQTPSEVANFISSGEQANEGLKSELLVKSLFEEMGFSVTSEVEKGNEQVDIILSPPNSKERYIVECKFYKNSLVPISVVDQVLNYMRILDGVKGFIISSSGFTNDALKKGHQNNLVLLTLDELITLRNIIVHKNFIRSPAKDTEVIIHAPLPKIKKLYEIFVASKTNDEKKKSLESLAKYILGNIDGFQVDNSFRGSAEEIDLLIRNEGKENYLRELKTPIYVECRNWAEPCGAKEVRDFRGKLGDHGLSGGILISRNGITGDDYHDAKLVMRTAKKDHIQILVLSEAHIKEIVDGTHPSDILREVFYDSFKL